MSDLLKNIDARTKLAGNNKLEILMFTLGVDNRSGRRETYGINVFKVREVMRVPEITQSPDMPNAVQGMVSLRGALVPVIDLRSRFGLPPRALEPDDQFVLAHGAGRTVALWADAVAGVEACSESELVAADSVLPGSELIEGVFKRPDGLVLVCNPQQIVPLAERKRLEGALHSAAETGAWREVS